MSGKLFKKIVSHLPKSARYPIFRNSLQLPNEIPKNLKFKLVSNEHEYFEALKVLHDCYVDRGFMNPDPMGIRFTPYHLLPSTLMAIATWDDKVVGTMSVIRDNQLGLPMDNIFNLSNMRKNGDILAEVSALAIHPDFRWSHGNLFHLLIRYLWIYSKEWYGIDKYVIAVNPAMADFYEAFYAFEPLTEKNIVGQYDFANGAPAVALSISVRDSFDIFKSVYEGKKEEKNIHTFMTKETFESEIYPDKKYFVMNDSFMNEINFSNVLSKIDDLSNRFSPDVRDKLANIYGYESYQNFQMHQKIGRIGKRSRSFRFDSKCPTHFITGSSQILSFEKACVQNLSRNGVRIKMTPEQLKAVEKELILQINLGPGINSQITAIPVWKNSEKNEIGLKVVSEDKNWKQLHETLNSEGKSHEDFNSDNNRNEPRLKLVG